MKKAPFWTQALFGLGGQPVRYFGPSEAPWPLPCTHAPCSRRPAMLGGGTPPALQPSLACLATKVPSPRFHDSAIPHAPLFLGILLGDTPETRGQAFVMVPPDLAACTVHGQIANGSVCVVHRASCAAYRRLPSSQQVLASTRQGLRVASASGPEREYWSCHVTCHCTVLGPRATYILHSSL